ncbi:hypothetical protein [Niallia nealsonii]|uniref:hypothetical protein n=1 Tax=Niallia nealsonii TaxID=115979 RepID=UPI001445AFB2|nr:hypothetical protein [Niallia nealsonii]
MWVITLYSKENELCMYEFTSEKEARETLAKLNGSKILSEVIYYNDPVFAGN